MELTLTYTIDIEGQEPFNITIKAQGKTEQECFVNAERLIDEKYQNCGFSLFDID